MSDRIQFRRGPAAAWTATNPVLAAGEPGFETDTGAEKRGDGTTAWTSLPYVPQLPSSVVRGSLLGSIAAIQGFGHSYMAAAYDPGFGFADYLAGKLLLGIDFANWDGRSNPNFDNEAIGGTYIQDKVQGWGHVMQTVTRPPGVATPDVHFLMHGLNDLAFVGNNLTAYAHALRASIARLRAAAGGIHTASPLDSSITGSGGGASTVLGTTNSGTGYLNYSTTSAVAQVAPSSSWPGGTLTVQLLALAGEGALLSAANSNTGFNSATAIDTRGIAPATPAGMIIPVAQRIPSLLAGAGYIQKLQATALSTAWQLDSWSEETGTPPVILVFLQPKLQHYVGGHLYVANDADIDALNAQILSVCAEFNDGRVIPVVTPSLNHPALCQSDGLHPSRLGAQMLAQAGYEALAQFGSVNNGLYGLGAATATGTSLQKANNLSDVGSVATTRTNLSIPLDNFTATTDPLVTSDTGAGYSPGSRWVNTSTSALYTCVSNATGAAVWKRMNTKVDVFTASGTYTKPAWCSKVTVACLSAGGGGGSGRQTASGTAASGGAGGSGGGYGLQTFAGSEVGSTVTVTVAAATAGGAAQASASTNGNAGTAAGTTSFGSLLRVQGGGAGGAGSTAASAAQSGGIGLGTGGTGGACSAGAAGVAGGTGPMAAPGGGAGGGLAATPAVLAGAAGGLAFTTAQNGGAGGTTDGQAGTVGVNASDLNLALPGSGAGGGASSIIAAGGTGGAGGTYGAGGGGGGASLNGQSSGAGGAGGPGIVVVISE